MKTLLTEEQKIEARRASQKKYALANKEKVVAASSLWNKRNKEKMREATKKWVAKKKDDPEYRAKKSAITREWARKNPDKVAEQSASKRASKLKRKPAWLTKEQKKKISEFYKVAQILSSSLDVQFHVDHIVPLRGKLVSGLHVPWNLTILPAQVNMEKSNKFL